MTPGCSRAASGASWVGREQRPVAWVARDRIRPAGRVARPELRAGRRVPDRVQPPVPRHRRRPRLVARLEVVLARGRRHGLVPDVGRARRGRAAPEVVLRRGRGARRHEATHVVEEVDATVEVGDRVDHRDGRERPAIRRVVRVVQVQVDRCRGRHGVEPGARRRGEERDAVRTAPAVVGEPEVEPAPAACAAEKPRVLPSRTAERSTYAEVERRGRRAAQVHVVEVAARSRAAEEKPLVSRERDGREEAAPVLVVRSAGGSRAPGEADRGVRPWGRSRRRCRCRRAGTTARATRRGPVALHAHDASPGTARPDVNLAPVRGDERERAVVGERIRRDGRGGVRDGGGRGSGGRDPRTSVVHIHARWPSRPGPGCPRRPRGRSR